MADSIHTFGMGFGMYSSAGTHACAGYAGSLGFEEVDAQTRAAWGVDYLVSHEGKQASGYELG